MGSSKLTILSFISLAFLSTSNVISSPIANMNGENTRIYLRPPQSEDIQNDPLIFESDSSESDWDGGRQTQYRLSNGASSEISSYSNIGSEQNTDRIDFQPTRPPSRHKYNRRPSLRTTPNVPSFNPSFLQSSSELCSTTGTDGKGVELNHGESSSSASQAVQTRISPSDDPIRTDPSSSSEKQKMNDEEELLNMFFAHIKSTEHPPPERIQAKKTKEGYPFTRKPGKFTYPLDKQGKKRKSKHPQDNTRNVVLMEMNDEDSDELAFLTFDSGIQRRKCASGTVKDGKCRPPSAMIS